MKHLVIVTIVLIIAPSIGIYFYAEWQKARHRNHP